MDLDVVLTAMDIIITNAQTQNADANGKRNIRMK